MPADAAEVAEIGEIWTIIVAAGSGSRFKRATPKQFVVIGGRRVLDWSAAVAAEVSDGVIVVMPPTGEHAAAPLPEITRTEMHAVAGGPTRTDSVRRGLAAVPDSARVVLVHDAARPMASVGLFRTVINAVARGAEAVVPVVPVLDSIRHVDGDVIDRDKLQVVQTPQGFDAETLRRAYADPQPATDDASLVSAMGGEVTTVVGERWNIKLTEPTDDLVIAALLSGAR